MKKLSTLLLFVIAGMTANAQISYTTLKNDGFETTDGFPTAFTKTGSNAWTSATAAYTGTLWLGTYTDAVVADRAQVSSISTVSPYEGTQCLKFEAKVANFNGAAGNLRIRTVDLIVPQAFADWNYYTVSFYAKTDLATSGKQLFKYSTQLITDQWQLITLTQYGTSVNVQQIVIDLLKQSPVIDFTVYIDKFSVVKKVYPIASAATAVDLTGFTANWSTVTGATGYTVSVQTELTPLPTQTWSTSTTYTVSDGAAVSSAITSLSPSTNYRYNVTATDGTITTPASAWTLVTTGTVTGLSSAKTYQVYASNGEVCANTEAGMDIIVYNNVGQQISKSKSILGLNKVAVNAKGVVLVKIGSQVSKVVL